MKIQLIQKPICTSLEIDPRHEDSRISFRPMVSVNLINKTKKLNQYEEPSVNIFDCESLGVDDLKALSTGLSFAEAFCQAIGRKSIDHVLMHLQKDHPDIIDINQPNLLH